MRLEPPAIRTLRHLLGRSAFVFLLMSGGVLLAQSPVDDQPETLSPPAPTSSASNAPSTEDMVTAARAAKAKRVATKGKKKVITNADVKRARGRLIFISDGSHQKEAAKQPLSAEDRRTLNQRDDDRIRDRKSAEEKLTSTTEQVDDLRAALAVAEQKYYESNDPGYRDSVLRERFETARTRLESARNEAAAARDELAKHEPPS